MDGVIKKKGTFSVLGVQSPIDEGSESSELFATIWERFESYGEIFEEYPEKNSTGPVCIHIPVIK